MAFSSSQMESAWSAVISAAGETEWVHLVNTATGDYFRFLLTSGTLKHWNRSTGAWEVGSLPASWVVVIPSVA